MAYIIVVGFLSAFSLLGSRQASIPLNLTTKETGSSMTAILRRPDGLFWIRRCWKIVVRIINQQEKTSSVTNLTLLFLATENIVESSNTRQCKKDYKTMDRILNWELSTDPSLL